MQCPRGDIETHVLDASTSNIHSLREEEVILKLSQRAFNLIGIVNTSIGHNKHIHYFQSKMAFMHTDELTPGPCLLFTT